MAGLEEWGVALTVIGLLLGLLVMAAIVQRYQAYLATIEILVRQLERDLFGVERALDALVAIPLSLELRLTLRGEVLARYRKIRAVRRRYPQIDEKLRLAETALNGQGPPPPGGVGPIDGPQAMQTIVEALDQLAEFVGQGRPVRPVPSDVRAIFVRELGERRAETTARFHLVAAQREEQDGRVSAAREHLRSLVNLLRSRGPSTDFVRELFNQAETALGALNDRQKAAEAQAKEEASDPAEDAAPA